MLILAATPLSIILSILGIVFDRPRGLAIAALVVGGAMGLFLSVSFGIALCS